LLPFPTTDINRGKNKGSNKAKEEFTQYKLIQTKKKKVESSEEPFPNRKPKLPKKK